MGPQHRSLQKAKHGGVACANYDSAIAWGIVRIGQPEPEEFSACESAQHAESAVSQLRLAAAVG